MATKEDLEKSHIRTVRTLVFIVIGVVSLFIGTLGLYTYLFKRVSDDMYNTYINNTKQIILQKEEIEAANAWERMPVNQQKEILRRKFNEIVVYYSTNVPENQKLSDKQILDMFNTLYGCTAIAKSVNFFLPLAYMKVQTNFNPNYKNSKWQHGIAWLLIKEGKDISNLPTITNPHPDNPFRVAYKGKITLLNPTESLKLLIAKMDDLMSTFNNREDWVILSLIKNEYWVIDKFWEGGKGAISDEYYESGSLADTLKYYSAFRNLKIIPNE